MEFRVLGPLEVVDQGMQAPLGGPKQRAVLTLLLLRANQLVSADRLIAELWDDRTPPRPRVSLQSYVSNLRRALDAPERIEGHAGGYVLRASPSELDAFWFEELSRDARVLLDTDPGAAVEKLEAALRLWRGRPLEDLNGLSDRDPFRAEIVRLEELHVRARQDHARALSETGDAARAVGELEALVDEHPLREDLWSLLMIALYRSGRQADALAAYQRLRSILAEELGIDPSPEVQRTHERVLAQDPGLLRLAADAPMPTVTEPVVPDRNPYKGLRSFRESDAQDFFGREPLVQRLVDRIADSRFLAVVGPSGSGKSSVVRAGLVPAVRAGAIDGSDEWVVADLYPGAHPLEELEGALLRVAANPPNSLLEQLGSGHEGLLRASKRVLGSADAELLLVIDQFEELYTLTGDDRVRQHVLEIIRAAVEDPRSRVRVVVTIRADLYDRPLADRAIAELIRGNVETVVPLSSDEIERTVSQPARNVGVDLEPGLLARIVSEVTEQPGSLPLLQYALTELFERRDGPVLTLETYDGLGGVSGALARRADETLDALSPEAQVTARQVLLRLVTLGDGVADARRRVRRSELEALDLEHLDEVLEALREARLLAFDRDPVAGTATVEVAHEALLREWGRLRDWIDAARESVRTERRLAEATEEWIASGREPSFLAAGGRLDGLANWRASSDLGLTQDEREYLDASIAHQDHRRAEEEEKEGRERELERRSVRRLRVLVAVLAAGALVASVLTVFAVGQRERAQVQAQVAQARELSAASVASLEIDPERSILLALEAVGHTRGVDDAALRGAKEVLHQALDASRVELHLPELGGDVAFHPDGALLGALVTERPGVVRLVDAATGEIVRDITAHDAEVTGIAFASDGVLATAGMDGTVAVWDVDSGEELRRLSGPHPSAGAPSFSADGRRVAAAFNLDEHEGGAILVWEVPTGEVVGEVDMGAGRVALSPDGRQVAFTHSFETETAAVVDLETGEERFRIPSNLGHPEISWSPDGRWIVAANGIVWDAESGRRHTGLTGRTGFVGDPGWSADSTRLVAAGSEGVKVWAVDGDGVRELLTLSAHDMSSGVDAVAITADGQRVAGTAGEGVRIWDAGPRGNEEWLTVPVHGPMFAGIAWSPDDRHLALNVGDGIVHLIDTRSGESVRSIETIARSEDLPFRAVDNIEWDPTGELIATSGSDGAIAVWDVRTGRERFRVDHGGFTGNAHWSPDGQRLAVASAGGDPPRIVDRSGDAMITFDHDEGLVVEGIRFSPDGRIVATTDGDTGLNLWDAATGRLIRTVETPAYNLAFHPDGQRLVTADAEGTPRILDVATGEEVAALSGHTAPVQDVTVSPDGTTIATAGWDSSVRLWDAETSEALLALPGHDTVVHRVRFSADGSRLASIGLDSARVWALDLDDLIAIARAELTRGFTDGECRLFLRLDGCSAVEP